MTITIRKMRGLLLCCGLLAANTAVADEFNANIFFPPQHPLACYGYVEWADDVARISDGALTAKVFAGTDLLPPRGNLSGTRDGITHVSLIAGTYTPAELPISNAIQELGLIYSDPLVVMIAVTDFNLHNSDALAQWQRVGIVYGGGYSTPPYNLMCSTPIQNVENLKGKRLRTPGAAVSRWAELVGAVPVNVPSSEMYQGLEKGAIDCAVNVASDLKSRSLWDVSKFTTMASLGMYWSGPIWGYNMEFWKGLSTEERRALFDAQAIAMGKLYVGYQAEISEALDEAKAHGVTVYQPSDDIVASINDFGKSSLTEVYKTATDKYGVANAEALIGDFMATVEKWDGLIAGVDRTDAEAIATLIRSQLYDKIDVTHYGVE